MPEPVSEARRAEIEQAIARARAAIASREEAEDFLRIGRVRVKAVKSEKNERINPLRSPPNFRVPYIPERRHAMPGGTTFHFQMTSVSKQGQPIFNGKPLDIAVSMAASALAHAAYVEREGAAELRRIDVENMIVRGADEGRERTLDASLDGSELADQKDIEAAHTAEPSVFSNISDDPIIRQQFWEAIERCERAPRSHKLIPNTSISLDEWQQLLALDDGQSAAGVSQRRRRPHPVPARRRAAFTDGGSGGATVTSAASFAHLRTSSVL
jgi:hypothetical protein